MLKMPSKKETLESRRLLQNPYAYLDGEAAFDAAPKVVDASAAQIATNRRMLRTHMPFSMGQGT
jgi:hypothetical protein